MYKTISIILFLGFLTLTAFTLNGICEGGTTYYVDSTNGNDTNAGTSPFSAWKTISKVNNHEFKPGDSILFKRGEMWRECLILCNSGSIKNPITIGAYGSGNKPLILGSNSKNDIEDWLNLENNLWATVKKSYPNDVGFILLGAESKENVGIKRDFLSKIPNDAESKYGNWYIEDTVDAEKEYWHDEKDQRIILCCERNPALRYSNIEIAQFGREPLIKGININNIIIENLEFKYFNAHGLSFVNCEGISIKNCNISYGGGTYLEEKVRFGNGIEFWENTNNCLVINCKIWEIYDAALTNQGTESNIQQNISYVNNTIWNSEYSFEIWNRPESSIMNNIYIENNICIGAGFGWSHKQRVDPHGWHLALWGNKASTDNILIQNNVFYEAASAALFYTPDESPVFDYEINNNSYYQASDYMVIFKYDKAYKMNQFDIYQKHWKCDQNSVTGDKELIKKSARDMVNEGDIKLLNELFSKTDKVESLKNEGVTLEEAFTPVKEKNEINEPAKNNSKKIPGFEITLIITASLLILFEKRKYVGK